MKFLSNSIFNGTITANSVADAGTNTDKFLVLNSSGVVTYRTAAELYGDLNIANLPAGSTSTVKHQVKLGEAINKGQVAYVPVGFNSSTNMVVIKASNASEGTSSKTMGLIETSGVTNDLVNIITEGLLAGLDTSTATQGDPVWLGTNGNLIFGLLNKPVAPAHLVFVGIVTRVNQNNGEIFVKVQNGFEMGELHNYAESGVQNNDVIVWENSTSLYKPKSIPTILGYTPANAATTLTINDVTYDLSANRSWTISSTSVSTRVIQKFTADGSSATYTITGGYTVGMVDVYVNGIKLDNASGVEFTATNGTTVVLVSTPASGDIVEVYKYGSQFIANNALRQKTLFTATAGQTTFTVTYSVGMVDVFYNGSKLDDTEYTATNGTSIVFNTACLLNDKVEVIAYSYTVGAFTGVGGSGTAGKIPKLTSSGIIGDSIISENSGVISISGGFDTQLNQNATSNFYFRNTNSTDVNSRAYLNLIAGTSSLLFKTIQSDHQYIDASGNLYFQSSGSVKMAIKSNGDVYISGSGYLGIGTSVPENQLQIGSNDGVPKTFQIRYSTVPAFMSNTWTGTYSKAVFSINYYDTSNGSSSVSSCTNSNYAAGSIEVRSSTGGSDIIFNTTTSVNSAPSERMRINSSGHILFGQTSANGTVNGIYFRPGIESGFIVTNDIALQLSRLGSTGDIQSFYSGNTRVGTISVSSSNTSYNTSSDYRLKEDLRQYNGLDLISKINTYDFAWKNDKSRNYGVIAHEIAEIMPYVVMGEKDGEFYQGVDYSKIVPVLIKGMQEQQAQIDDLKKLIN